MGEEPAAKPAFGWEAADPTPAQPGWARSAAPISKAVIGLLVVGLLLDAASIAHEVNGLTLIDRYVAHTVALSDLNAWDALFATLALLSAGVFIITGLVWFAWQYRLVASVERLGLGSPYKTPGRSILWWFVPLAN